MKVLWVTNTIFPDLSIAMGNDAPVIGGWMYGLAKDLTIGGLDLHVATAKQNTSPLETKINNITYHLLNGQKSPTSYDASLENQWKKIVDKMKPDVIHIHGTEYAFGLSLLKACPNQNYVVSIQGLISVSARYFTGRIPIKEIKKNRTFRDFFRNDSILQAKRKFEVRGELIEKEYFKRSKNFIGRTQWDHDHTKALNRNIRYYFCNESLRDSFYISKKWNITTKENYTIFLSQAGYPIKGLHQVIRALSFLKSDFPDVKVRVAGIDILKRDTFNARIRMGGFAKYVIGLMDKFDLHDNIEFTGFLDEEQMIQEYLNCHVFICPSSIENSPNSIGEAQILGTPCIASYVGGVADMVEDGQTGLLYRFEEVEMLAEAIRRVFTDSTLATRLSENGIEEASKRHHRETNSKTTLEIYSRILSNSRQ